MSTLETIASLGLTCGSCGWSSPVSDLAWRCGRCQGVLDLTGFTPAMPGAGQLAGRPQTLWRYRESLPVSEPAGLSMGEGMTPLLPAPGRPEIAIKVDFLMPTGSFKDRGAVLLAALASLLGVGALVADSSGNAGTAIAAYAARLGIACDVYVPAATSAGKLAQLHAYGAAVHRVEGSREDTAAAAQAAGRPGTFYASHVYNPVFLHGTKTYVFELWEQLGGRLPGTLVLPVGNGTLVLGCHLGSRELLDQGLIDRLPAIIAVQADACAPLARARREGRSQPAEITPEPTIAEGIAIARPARGGQVLAVVAETGGAIVTVTDEQVRAARADLAGSGLYVEPTSAVCWAAVMAGLAPAAGPPGENPDVVLPLCGTGLKSAAYG
jgi:threonine synthase